MSTTEPGYRFAARVAGLKSSAIREILQVVNRPDVISFAGGLPAPELFPTELLGALARDLFQSREGPQALQYGETEGIPALRARILERAPFAPGTFGEDGVLVTQGSQQGLDLVAKLFVDPGDEVLVETPAYVGALQALTFLGARVTFLPCDGEGLLPDALAAALRRQVAELDPDLPAFDLATMDQRLATALAAPRFNTMLLGIFAGLALLLAIVGIYGVISYLASQRTHEIGVRMALGAVPKSILRLLLGEALVITLLGLALGVAGALALTRYLAGLLFEVRPTDPVTLITLFCVLCAVSVAASYIPARRAARVDPLVALRYE